MFPNGDLASSAPRIHDLEAVLVERDATVFTISPFIRIPCNFPVKLAQIKRLLEKRLQKQWGRTVWPFGDSMISKISL